MSNPKPAQQGGSQTAHPQQQGQVQTPPPQQGNPPIIRDWASI